MECNKEEAFRAKGLAEKKMENKDFLGARKIAIKARNLFPELENISQLIMVCDVHCSAESKVHGTEMDWYGILKVEPTADDLLIKKQFRKFALLLHPDKNKFSGAADAFKLIGEAHRVLLDREKRRIHDMKCKSASVNVPDLKCNSASVNGFPKRASRPFNVRKTPASFYSSVELNKQNQQAPQTSQTGSCNIKPTFWTACPFCFTRYQYYRDVLNRTLTCQTCGEPFSGCETNAQGVAPQNKRSQLASSKQTLGRQRASSKVRTHSKVENCPAKLEVGGNNGIGNTWSSEGAQGSKLNEKRSDVSMNCKQKRKAEKVQPLGNMIGKKRKKISDSNEKVSIDIDGFYNGQFPRRSSRSEKNVSYTEEINDDDGDNENKCRDASDPTKDAVEDLSPKQEPPGMNRSTGLDAHMAETEEEAKTEVHPFPKEGLRNRGNETENGRENEKLSKDAENEQDIYEYPNPDFSVFDKNREEKCFAAGQIWAVYDTQDAMPRFYALIRKVILSKFKLWITWLEPDPDDKDEIKWAQEDLPVSCGNFKLGCSEYTNDHSIFSHVVNWEKNSRRGTYTIYPRKGETWALFKNWNSNWSSDPDNNRKYDYEFVEVLSDYANRNAVRIAYMGKVKGYVCLFCRAKQAGVGISKIEPKELFRFSHRIPSFQINGKEREGIPKGSFEFDPACLPANLGEIDLLASEEIKSNKMPPVGSCFTFATNTSETVSKFHVDASKNHKEQRNNFADEKDQISQFDSNGNTFNNPVEKSGTAPASPEEAYEISDPENYNFDTNKSIEKFEMGQVWALYSDEDGLPKKYAKIKKIDLLSEQKLRIVWLGVSSTPNDMIQWKDRKMPVALGRFVLKKMKLSQYTTTASFSHQVRARVESKDKKEEVIIMPRKGEVWALYKSWNACMKCSDLENCDYDIVEVVEENSWGISVLFLEAVNGFMCLVRAQVKGEWPVMIKIPTSELLRFSHQIPAHRLTERFGLRGCLELDPAGLPARWFCKV